MIILPVEGIVTMGDVLGVVPFRNKMVLMRLKGSDIKEMLEWSVENYSPGERKGKFLQMSGRHYINCKIQT